MTNSDIKQIVHYAMIRPSYLSFNRACFVIGRMTDKTPEEIASIVRGNQELSEIVDAMRIPATRYNKPDTGATMIF